MGLVAKKMQEKKKEILNILIFWARNMFGEEHEKWTIMFFWKTNEIFYIFYLGLNACF